jgi:peptidoglycan/xylan/chitin deacetylase (PgdA/CDA1 family)
MSQRVPILMYHEVTPRPLPAFRKYSVTPDELDQHVRWLARRGYHTVHLDAVVDAWAGRRPLPPRAVVLTFDDGFRDCLAYAPPVLQAHGFTATFFLVAGLMGDTSRWLVRERGLELPMTTWATARALEEAGFRCEAHTVTHPRLGELAPDACRDELVRGRAMLEDGLGRAVRHLAYPFGSWSPTARASAEEAGYLTACTTREGRAGPTDDLLALPRVPVVGGAGLPDFIARLYTAYSTRQLLHATASGLRRRLLGARDRA